MPGEPVQDELRDRPRLLALDPGRIGGGSPEDVRIDQGLGMVSERAERAVVDPQSLEHDVGVVGCEDVGGG